VTTAAIHRLVEQQASLHGDAPALLEGDRARSYRHLNYAANALARRLLASGFRRSSHATVSMPLGIDLAVVLLAILKAGGSYTWAAPDSGMAVPPGLSFSTDSRGGDARYLHLDIGSVLTEPVSACPNLPIVTRGSDVACILQEADGSPVVMVPHATIASLRPPALPQQTPWMGDAGAFDLWIALMTGTTAVVESHPAAVAA
jgi:non-ribosomal peptide synthetase component F